jgi:hypothetical protein
MVNFGDYFDSRLAIFSSLCLPLQEVPAVPIEILEDGDGAVGFLARQLAERDAAGAERVIIAPEVVGVQEEQHPAAPWSPTRASCPGDDAFARSRRVSREPGGASSNQRLPSSSGVSSTTAKPSTLL